MNRRETLTMISGVVAAVVAADGESSEPPKTLPLEFVKRAGLRPISEKTGFTAFSVRAEDGQIYDVRDVLVALVELAEPHWRKDKK